MKDSNRGNFKGYNEQLFLKACELGLNEAVAFLVISCGTGATGSVSKWSSTSIESRTGISWKNAKKAINLLVENQIINLTEDSTKNRPRYAVNNKDDDCLVWLPNGFINGIINEDTGEVIESPLSRLRFVRNIDYLKIAFFLYKYQSLSSDGGIERELTYRRSELDFVCSIGVCDFFTSKSWGEPVVNESHNFFTDTNILINQFTSILKWFVNNGLIVETLYLFESSDLNSEILYPVKGNKEFENVMSRRAVEYISTQREKLAKNLSYSPRKTSFKTMNINHNNIMEIMKKSLITPIPQDLEDAHLFYVYRMAYLPYTKPTQLWFSKVDRNNQKFSRLLNTES